MVPRLVRLVSHMEVVRRPGGPEKEEAEDKVPCQLQGIQAQIADGFSGGALIGDKMTVSNKTTSKTALL
jgi:hypothetical protein